MTTKPRVLAIVPARGGSKGIPDKNLITLAGRPLLAWTLDAAQAASSIDRIVLSSDSEAICQQGRELGFDVPFLRPAALAQDDTPGIAPVLHALDTLEETYKRSDASDLLIMRRRLNYGESVGYADRRVRGEDEGAEDSDETLREHGDQ